MARAKRGFMDGGIYHILNRGNGKQKVFLKDGDYAAFVDLLEESRKHFDFMLYAYCVMPNHFHFVVACPKADTYSVWVQWLTTAHARRYHKHYGGSGHVWQGRFKSFLVQTDEYLLNVLRYVEANPIRANLTHSGVLWQWSSCSERVGRLCAKMLAKPPIKMPVLWEEWVDRALGEAELDAIRRSVHRQTPYGSRSWQEEICKRLGIESVLNPLGRPKKGSVTFSLKR